MLTLTRTFDVEGQFNKQYCYAFNNKDVDHVRKVIRQVALNRVPLKPELLKLKTDLNEVKTKLSDVDILCWHKHTSQTNPAGFVVQNVRSDFHVELCTQAWCKFYDLLNNVDIVPKSVFSRRHADSLHLCEAPGAFITALNHYLKSQKQEVSLNWLATTLNPYYEGNSPDACIVDDRLIFLTQNNWCFGCDNTGDILLEDNANNIFNSIKLKFPSGNVDIVTADGSVNCQEDPSSQELHVHKLLYCELYIALRCLKEGGSFVLKCFTLFEPVSMLLMYILTSTFQIVNVRKPSVSKPGNSEVYIVATNFKGTQYSKSIAEDVKVLILFPQHMQHKDQEESNSQFPKEFLDCHIECVEYFCSKQIQTIEENLTLFKQRHNRNQHGLQQQVKHEVYEQYKTVCNLGTIKPDDRIVSSGKLCGTMKSNLKPRSFLQGSFGEHKFVSHHHWHNEDLHNLRTLKRSKTTNERKINLGKKISQIYFSLFCSTKWLEPFAFTLHERGTKTESDVKITYMPLGYKELKDILPLLSNKDTHEVNYDIVNFNIWMMLEDYLHIKMYFKVNEGQSSTIVFSLTNGVVASLHDEFQLLLTFIRDLKFRLKKGGNAIFLMPLILRRSSAGMVLLVRELFEEITMFPLYLQLSTGAFGAIVCSCTSYVPNENLQSFVEDIHKLNENRNKDNHLEIVEVVPVQQLLQDRDFVKMLKNSNEALLEQSFDDMQHP